MTGIDRRLSWLFVSPILTIWVVLSSWKEWKSEHWEELGWVNLMGFDIRSLVLDSDGMLLLEFL